MAIAELAPESTRESGDRKGLVARLTGLQRWGIWFLLLGCGWRLLRYFMQFPIWGDEACMTLNFLDQTHLGLLDGMKHGAVAPILFLWGELTAFQWFGGSELALRMIPVLAGLAALPLFWFFARQILDQRRTTIAFAILAVAYYPARHAVEVRPYSLDLLISIGLMSLAYAWMQDPKRLRCLLALCLILPMALGLSNPIVFVCGGISLALLPTVWQESKSAKISWVVYNIVLVTAFLGYLQLHSRMVPAETREFLDHHWDHAFPPTNFGDLIKWLAMTHTGNMFAYPAGGKNGASVASFLLFLMGVWAIARQNRWQLLVMLLAPFALTFIASAMRRYPYGDSARFCQHLAPATCLLMAVGIGSLISLGCHTLRNQKFATTVILAALSLIGVIGMARDLVQPYKTTGDRECRRIVHEIIAKAGPGTPIVMLAELSREQMLTPTPTTPVEVLWYFFSKHPQARWGSRTDWDAMGRSERVVCIRLSHDTAPTDPPAMPHNGWRLAHCDTYSRPLDSHTGMTEIIEVFDYCRQ